MPISLSRCTKTYKNANLLSNAFSIVNFKFACILLNFSKNESFIETKIETVISENSKGVIHIGFIIKFKEDS